MPSLLERLMEDTKYNNLIDSCSEDDFDPVQLKVSKCTYFCKDLVVI